MPERCAMRYIARRGNARHSKLGYQRMFKPIAAMRRGTATNLSAAWAGCPTLAAAKLGTALEHDRVGRTAHQRRAVRQRRRLARFWRYLFPPNRSFIGWQPVTTQPTPQQ